MMHDSLLEVLNVIPMLVEQNVFEYEDLDSLNMLRSYLTCYQHLIGTF